MRGVGEVTSAEESQDKPEDDTEEDTLDDDENTAPSPNVIATHVNEIHQADTEGGGG